MRYVKRTVLKRLEEVSRIVEASHDSHNLGDNGWFTGAELEYCADRLRCLGARYLIKECIFDYLESETGQVKKDYREIEILNDERRRPMIKISKGLSACVKGLKIKDIVISISHSRNWITGMVLFCY